MGKKQKCHCKMAHSTRVKLGRWYREKYHKIEGLAAARQENLSGIVIVRLERVEGHQILECWFPENRLEAIPAFGSAEKGALQGIAKKRAKKKVAKTRGTMNVRHIPGTLANIHERRVL